MSQCANECITGSLKHTLHIFVRDIQKFTKTRNYISLTHTVVSKTSSTRGGLTWIGFGSADEANIAPSLPKVMITVRHPKHRKLQIARFASLQYLEVWIFTVSTNGRPSWLAEFLSYPLLCTVNKIIFNLLDVGNRSFGHCSSFHLIDA